MQEFGLIKSLPENICLSVGQFLWFFFFSQSIECLIFDFYPELLSGGVEGQQLAVVMM